MVPKARRSKVKGRSPTRASNVIAIFHRRWRVVGLAVVHDYVDWAAGISWIPVGGVVTSILGSFISDG